MGPELLTVAAEMFAQPVSVKTQPSKTPPAGASPPEDEPPVPKLGGGPACLSTLCPYLQTPFVGGASACTLGRTYGQSC